MSVPYLPDPTDMDLSLIASQHQIVDENVRQKLSMFEVMEQQLEEKEQLLSNLNTSLSQSHEGLQEKERVLQVSSCFS